MDRSEPIRVAVLNDDPIVVAGLGGLLERYPDRVQVVDVSAQATTDAWCDVALFDTFANPDPLASWSDHVGDGWEPQHVVLYTWDESRTQDEPDVATPPVPRISKALDGRALVAAIEDVCAGRGGSTPVDDGAAATGDQPPSTTDRQWPGKEEGLTERESEIVTLVATGISNVEIGERLFIGVNTVKTYIRSAYRTMGVTDRPNAILWAVDHGFRSHRPAR